MSVRALLERVASGGLAVDAALEMIAAASLTDLGDVVLDLSREARQGMPEVIFGRGKSADQVVRIAAALLEKGQRVLVTRAAPDVLTAVRLAHPTAVVSEVARTARIIPRDERIGTPPAMRVAIVTAGTTDLSVAEEARETLRAVNLEPTMIVDVGVAGLHRLLSRADSLRSQDALIVVAGMEGALPSVVAGLVACPVVAVPTSTGYGAALDGFTAMLANLTSCGSGVTVVNIDNGFGAAMAVHRMANLVVRSDKEASP